MSCCGRATAVPGAAAIAGLAAMAAAKQRLLRIVVSWSAEVCSPDGLIHLGGAGDQEQSVMLPIK